MRCWWLPLWLLWGMPAVDAADHAVILLYHRIADTGPASTRVAPARFAAHLDLIRDQGYQVIPLAELLDIAAASGEFPERALAISFDDAYRSVGEVAYPMLREHGMPFTVFVATDVVDSGGSAFLDWPMLRAMAGEGLASFGPHSLSHAHLESLVSADAAEQPADPREREIDGSLQRLRSELGDTVINAFAYPYGEYSQGTESILAQRGLYGLAQQSGAVGAATPLTRIPRFPLYSGADSDSRLLTALAAQPLPVIDEGETQVFFPAPLLPPGEWRLRPALVPFSATLSAAMRPPAMPFASAGLMINSLSRFPPSSPGAIRSTARHRHCAVAAISGTRASGCLRIQIGVGCVTDRWVS